MSCWSALLGQHLNAHEGLGLLNSQFYGLALAGQAYAGPEAPLRAFAELMRDQY